MSLRKCLSTYIRPSHRVYLASLPSGTLNLSRRRPLKQTAKLTKTSTVKCVVTETLGVLDRRCKLNPIPVRSFRKFAKQVYKALIEEYEEEEALECVTEEWSSDSGGKGVELLVYLVSHCCKMQVAPASSIVH
eukprot:3602764-Pleurochrysis_carterae.AAC.2